jgi:hypothetical protein
MTSNVNADSEERTGISSQQPAAWDPYEVWRTRVQQPRFQAAQRLLKDGRAGESLSPAAGRSRRGRWSPWRRATSPRS